MRVFCRRCRQMNFMKSIRLLVLTTAFLLGFTGIAAARRMLNWSYQELLEKSDLVVLATPAATNDTKEHIELPGFGGLDVTGVETEFTVAAVLKGDKALKRFVLHHYRSSDAPPKRRPDGPGLIFFTPAGDPTISPRTFILFLLREADGRYAPVVGQTDAYAAVRELRGDRWMHP